MGIVVSRYQLPEAGWDTVRVDPVVTYQRALYTVPVKLLPGDVLDAEGRFQVTNDLGYNVMVRSFIVLATDPAAATGTIIARAVAENITPAQHHMPRERSGKLEVIPTTEPARIGAVQAPPEGITRHLNLIVGAAASSVPVGANPVPTLKVDDYGDLIATIHRP